MLAFIARRLLALIPLIVIVTFVAFGLVYLLPGDAAVVLAGDNALPQDVERIRAELDLDGSFFERYGRWVGGVLTGDFGSSIRYPDRSVGTEILDKLPTTFSVAFGAVVLAAILGGILGTIAGLRPGRLVDRAISLATSVAIGVPSYVVAILLVAFFAVNLGWLPSIGYTKFTDSPWGWVEHLIMPWIALALPASASIARQVRGAIVDTMQEDYIRTARAKGLSGVTVVAKHAMKNASMPAITVIGIQFAYLLGGTVIIEKIFSINGLGRMIAEAIGGRDVPVIQGIALLMAIVFLIVNLAVDVAYAVVNPKVRLA